MADENKLITLDALIKFIDGNEKDLIDILDDRYIYNSSNNMYRTLLEDSDDPEFPYRIINDSEVEIYNRYIGHVHDVRSIRGYSRVLYNAKRMTSMLEERRMELYRVLKKKHIDVKMGDSMEVLLSKLTELNIGRGFLNSINMTISYSDDDTIMVLDTVDVYYQFSIDGDNWEEEHAEFPVNIGDECTIYGKDNNGNIYSKTVVIPDKV